MNTSDNKRQSLYWILDPDDPPISDVQIISTEHCEWVGELEWVFYISYISDTDVFYIILLYAITSTDT